MNSLRDGRIPSIQLCAKIPHVCIERLTDRLSLAVRNSGEISRRLVVQLIQLVHQSTLVVRGVGIGTTQIQPQQSQTGVELIVFTQFCQAFVEVTKCIRAEIPIGDQMGSGGYVPCTAIKRPARAWFARQEPFEVREHP